MRKVPRPSSDTDIAHHTGFLMLDNVSMEHPIARIVGDEGELDALLRQHEDRIAV